MHQNATLALGQQSPREKRPLSTKEIFFFAKHHRQNLRSRNETLAQ
jgi:hypothetical protein